MREVPAAERPPAVEVNGFAEAAAAYSRAGIYTGLAMWIVWALAKMRLDKMEFLRFTQQHKIARYDSLDAGWRDVFQKFARLYARAYTSPAAAPNRLELSNQRSAISYQPVTFHDGDPPPRPPRADDDEAGPPAKDLTRVDKIFPRSESGAVIPPPRLALAESPPELTESEAITILRELGINWSRYVDWLWKQENHPKCWYQSAAILRKWAARYLERLNQRE
jgi:hypothetical protein